MQRRRRRLIPAVVVLVVVLALIVALAAGAFDSKSPDGVTTTVSGREGTTSTVTTDGSTKFHQGDHHHEVGEHDQQVYDHHHREGDHHYLVGGRSLSGARFQPTAAAHVEDLFAPCGSLLPTTECDRRGRSMILSTADGLGISGAVLALIVVAGLLQVSLQVAALVSLHERLRSCSATSGSG